MCGASHSDMGFLWIISGDDPVFLCFIWKRLKTIKAVIIFTVDCQTFWFRHKKSSSNFSIELLNVIVMLFIGGHDEQIPVFVYDR